LAFADVAKSDSFSTGDLVVADADGAFFALRDVATFVADKPIGISFFVYDNCNIPAFGDVFVESFFG